MTKNIFEKAELNLVYPRGNFLVSLQKITGCRGGCVINRLLGGSTVIDQFQEDGIIPASWRTFLEGFEEGPVLIERFERDLMIYLRNEQAILREVAECVGLKCKSAKLISRGQTPLVLALARIYTRPRNNVKIAEALGVRVDEINCMCEEKKCLSRMQLGIIVKNLSILEGIFQKWL